jgi:hypothetical protein
MLKENISIYDGVKVHTLLCENINWLHFLWIKMHHVWLMVYAIENVVAHALKTHHCQEINSKLSKIHSKNSIKYIWK